MKKKLIVNAIPKNISLIVANNIFFLSNIRTHITAMALTVLL